MKVFLTFLIVALSVFYSSAQSFLSDSSYKIGDTHIEYNLIRFESFTANLLPLSAIFLDTMASFLLRNPDVRLEIGVHFDERCPAELSTCRSCLRAESIKLALMSRGVDSNLLIAKGYQGFHPLKPNAKTEAEHRVNRRIEFKIIDILNH